MNKSDSIKELAAALCRAQSEFPAIPRSREVTVKSDKGSYKFHYAPFEDILRATLPARTRNGLSFTQGEHDGTLVTAVLHSSGEWFSHETKIIAGSSEKAQAYGSALTYARRYGFCGAHGVQADDDDDGNAADGNHIEASTDKGPLTALKKDAFEALDPEEQEFLRKIQANVAALLEEQRDGEAHALLEGQKLDMEEKLAIWFLFDSKQRSALKAAAAFAEKERKARK